MAIPDYVGLMLPLLQHIADGDEYTIAGSRDVLAEKFNLSEEELKERLPSGAANLFHNRLAWAKTYLERAGLIAKVRRGCFKISSAGKDVLADPPDNIDLNFLKQFSGTIEFLNKGKSDGAKPVISEAPTQNDATPDEALDPEEALENAYQRVRRELAADILAQVQQGTASFFERLVVTLMLEMGYGGVSDDAGSVTSRGADGGIDGIINGDCLGLDVLYLQAKRWEKPVGRPDIQKFVGALHGHHAKKGVFLTTSTFTREAKEYVKTIDPRVVLIDGMKLAQLMVDYNVAVSSVKTYDLKRVDSDYFENE